MSRGHFARRKVLVSGLPLGEHQQDNLVREDRLYLDRRGGLLVADWGRGVVYRIQADDRR